MNGHHRALCQNIQVLVGDERSDLDNRICLGIKARHFQIYPDQIEGVSDCSHIIH